jgi:hypothetical protein
VGICDGLWIRSPNEFAEIAGQRFFRFGLRNPVYRCGNNQPGLRTLSRRAVPKVGHRVGRFGAANSE